MSKPVVLRDGRSLGFAEYGDREGRAVFFFPGAGSSRLHRPGDASVLADLGIRFISTDRPGHGLSSPQPDRKLLDWPGDVSQLADHLHIDRFYVVGFSSGGPYALACAHKLAGRVEAGAIAGGIGPPERPDPYKDLPFANRMLMLGARRASLLVYLLRWLSYSMIKSDRDPEGRALISSFPPVDRELLETPEEREQFIVDIREGYRQGWGGPAQDDIIVNRPWGFPLEEISARFDIWQGALDRNVPLNQAHYQHQRIPHSRLAVWPDLAHLGLLARWREVLAALVA